METKTGTTTISACRKKRVESLTTHIEAHAATVVRDQQYHIALAGALQTDRNLAPLPVRKCMHDGIENQIGQHLPERTGVAVRDEARLALDAKRKIVLVDLEQRFRACDVGSKACQFSQAYVITHEIGNHVQNLLGLLPKVQEAQSTMDQAEANSLQVRVELQADCLAGVWANHSQKTWQFIEPGDVESAIKTASAIGDDRLQRRTQGHVVPDSFTHGTAEQRTRWFLTGLKSGTVSSCDTFRPPEL